LVTNFSNLFLWICQIENEIMILRFLMFEFLGFYVIYKNVPIGYVSLDYILKLNYEENEWHYSWKSMVYFVMRK
jgi:hypothetical protein